MRWLIWGLAALFYFFEYFLRISPSVLVQELIQAFAVNATAIGILSAFYFYIYAPMQIPVGLLMDRYGARKLLTLATVTCGVGAILFGLSPSYGLAAASRLFIGFGSSFAWVGLVYVSTGWFPANRIGFMVALGNSVAMIGAIAGEGPLAAVNQYLGWRMTMISVGIGGLLLALLMYLVIQQLPTRNSKLSLKEALANLGAQCRAVIGSGQSWLNGIIGICGYTTTSCLAGLWGVPFLVTTHGISQEEAGFASSMIFVGWLVGGPLFGYVSDQMGQRKHIIAAGYILAFFCLLPVIYWGHLPITVVAMLLGAIGFFSATQILNFPIAVELHNKGSRGTAIGFTNLLISGGAAGVQPLIGWLLDLQATGGVAKTGAVYTAAQFQTALTFFPASFLIGLLLILFLKEARHEDWQNHS